VGATFCAMANESDAMTPETDPNFTRRRIVVGGVALLGIGVAIVAAVGLTGGDESDTLTISVPSTTTTTTTLPPATTVATTTTFLPAATTTRPATTTTTTTSPSTTTTTSTTTTIPTPSTILENGVPIWEPYEPLPGLDGIAALTGEPAEADVTSRPIVAAKIDNFSRARPQWALDQADVIFEENVEGVTRFVALFHTRLPDRVGPVRSARTGDLDILASMNRPILAWSGGNQGVTNWIESAARSGILVDFTAQTNPCYNRNSSRRAPHNLQLNPSCAIDNAPTAGPARPLWSINAAWEVPEGSSAVGEANFSVAMDGVAVDWAWDAESGKYLRSQNGGRHLAASGNQIAVDNVVEMSVFHAPSPVDARSPNPITIGGANAVIHRNGISIPATWYRESAYDSFLFFDRSTGEPIELNEGTTFVELVRDRPR